MSETRLLSFVFRESVSQLSERTQLASLADRGAGLRTGPLLLKGVPLSAPRTQTRAYTRRGTMMGPARRKEKGRRRKKERGGGGGGGRAETWTTILPRTVAQARLQRKCSVCRFHVAAMLADVTPQRASSARFAIQAPTWGFLFFTRSPDHNSSGIYLGYIRNYEKDHLFQPHHEATHDKEKKQPTSCLLGPISWMKTGSATKMAAPATPGSSGSTTEEALMS